MFGLDINQDYDDAALSGQATVKLAETAREAAEDQTATKATVDILDRDFTFKFIPKGRRPRITLRKQEVTGKRINRGIGHANIKIVPPNRGGGETVWASYDELDTDEEIRAALWEVLTEAMDKARRDRWSAEIPLFP
jgi:hypothetical protein